MKKVLHLTNGVMKSLLVALVLVALPAQASKKARVLHATTPNANTVLSLAYYNSKLFIGTKGYGVVVKDLDTGTESVINTIDNYPLCMEIGGGKLYTGSVSGGISEISLGGNMDVTNITRDSLGTGYNIVAIKYHKGDYYRDLTICDDLRAHVFRKISNKVFKYECLNSASQAFNTFFSGITDVIIDSNGVEWVSSTLGTVKHEDYSLMRVFIADKTLATTLITEEQPNLIEAMCSGYENTIWLAGSNGIACYDYHNFRSCYTDEACYDIKMANDGTLWAISAKALIKYADGEITRYSTEDIEPQNNYCLVLGGDNIYIGGTSAGVYCFNSGKFTKIEYGASLAINSPETDSNAPAAIYDLQGRQLQERPNQGAFIENGRKFVK